LPYKLRYRDKDPGDFEKLLGEYLDLFELEIDLDLRPAYLKPSVLKLMCYIRSLLMRPKVLLIDNPYYLLNRFERKNLFRVLRILKDLYPIILASTDEDFLPPFASQLLKWNQNTKIFEHRSSIT
ncbi:MAG: hypothetical protein U1C33_02140, partial [Candidatus Cloacimonadaceae bacterium]|nr:hypothetical protein [Candidatus Cloacimonadaceae bacterium]